MNYTRGVIQKVLGVIDVPSKAEMISHETKNVERNTNHSRLKVLHPRDRLRISRKFLSRKFLSVLRTNLLIRRRVDEEGVAKNASKDSTAWKLSRVDNGQVKIYPVHQEHDRKTKSGIKVIANIVNLQDL